MKKSTSSQKTFKYTKSTKPEKSPKKHLREILFFSILTFVLLAGVAIAIVAGMNNDNSLQNKTSDIKKETTSKHDTSKMKEISAKEITAYTAGNASIVYIGRDSCGWSVKFSPIINKVIENLNLDILYIDLAKIVDISSGKTTDKASYNFLLNLGTVTKMKDYMKENFGGTPMILIIKDNVILDGNSGYMELSKFTEFLQKNGF